MKINDYYISIKDWNKLIAINRDRILTFYKYSNKEYGNYMNSKYSLFIYKTFPNIQCVHNGQVIWELNAATGKLKLTRQESAHHLNDSFEVFYKTVLSEEIGRRV